MQNYVQAGQFNEQQRAEFDIEANSGCFKCLYWLMAIGGVLGFIQGVT